MQDQFSKDKDSVPNLSFCFSTLIIKAFLVEANFEKYWFNIIEYESWIRLLREILLLIWILWDLKERKSWYHFQSSYLEDLG